MRFLKKSFFNIITYYLTYVKLRAHMVGPIGPRRFREKSGAYEKSLEVSEILHMGCAIGNSVRLLRRRPALSPLLLYHIEAGLSIGNLHKKKESFFSSLSRYSQPHRGRKIACHNRSKCRVLGCSPHFLRRCHTLRILRFRSKGI